MDIRSTRAFQLWQKYEHHLGVGALLVGFSFDFFLAKRPDSVVDNILLLCYLFIAGTVIITLNLQKSRKGQEWEPFFFLLILQFCFGGLSSNLLVLYGKSGTLTTSAIFIGLLVCLVFGNEYLRSRYSLLRFNVAVYFTLLMTYATIAVPVFITHSIGTLDFLLSGLISLVFIAVFLFILFITVFRGRDTRSLRGVSMIVGAIFIVFNLLYFLNFIPPVPLSLKDVGIYHSVLKDSSGNYVALYEPSPWWEFWRDTSATYDITTADQSAFCFSSVFAPTDLTAPIYHRWEYYDPTAKAWVTESRISFDISGGRAQGYRGFTTTANLTPGAWRCDVETAQGQLIGRATFNVVQAPSTPALSQTTL
jgi:hypothetical protein